MHIHVLSTQIFVPFLDGFYPSRDVGSTPELNILNVVSQEPSIVVKKHKTVCEFTVDKTQYSPCFVADRSNVSCPAKIRRNK